MNAAILKTLFKSLDIIILEQLKDGTFRVSGEPPEWYHALFSHIILENKDPDPCVEFPFLANFLIDAEIFWAGQKSGRLLSGPWIETDSSGREYPLEATAISVEKINLLLIGLCRYAYNEKQIIIQKGREHDLNYQHLEKLQNSLREAKEQAILDNQELKRNRNIIISQNCEQKELLHMLCHDLANPFQAIIFVAQMFDSYDDTYKLKKLMDNLLNVASKGTDIIDLVRKMQAVETGQFILEKCDLKEAIYETFFLLAGKFTEKDIRWQLSIKDDAELWVYAENTSLINSVLTNIFTNAIKFSFPGSKICIRAWLKKDQVFVSVKDDGIGMSGELLGNIFDIKKSVSRTGTNGEKGTGFGMPLIKKFIEAYNGDIQVSSIGQNEDTDNHGTEVLLTFKSFN